MSHISSFFLTIVLINVFHANTHLMLSGSFEGSTIHIDKDIEEEDRVYNTTCVGAVTMQLDYPDINCVMQCRYLKIKIFYYGYNDEVGRDTYLFNSTAIESFYRMNSNASEYQIYTMVEIYEYAKENTDAEIKNGLLSNEEVYTRRCIFFHIFYHWAEKTWNETNHNTTWSRPIVDWVA